MKTEDNGTLREFGSGATRDTAEGKIDMEGFTHPMVMVQFAKYMNMNRLQSDGTLRASDNWQKGIPKDVYVKSLRRHHDEVWESHRGFGTEAGMVAALCGVMFNSMGMLLEVLKDRGMLLVDFDGSEPTPEMRKRQDNIEKLAAERDVSHGKQALVDQHVEGAGWPEPLPSPSPYIPTEEPEDDSPKLFSTPEDFSLDQPQTCSYSVGGCGNCKNPALCEETDLCDTCAHNSLPGSTYPCSHCANNGHPDAIRETNFHQKKLRVP